MKRKLVLGTDPEVFLAYKGSDGKFYVAPPVFLREDLGVKPIIEDRKHPVFIQTSRIKVHQDGAAFEFATPTFKNAWEAKNILEEGLNALNDFANRYGLFLYTKPTINFDPEVMWKGRGESFRDCVISGCDPDKDAFNFEKYNINTFSTETDPIRCGGGHLHISGHSDLVTFPIPGVKLLAITVGNYFIKNSLYPEHELMRATHYGKPGKFRMQEYPSGEKGVEYRTPSNSWITQTVENIQGMFEEIDHALYFLENPELGKDILHAFANKTVEAITTANQKLAEEVLSALPTE